MESVARPITGTTVWVATVAPLMRAMEAAGDDVDVWLEGAGLSRSALEDPEARLGREAVGDLWRSAVELSGDPRLGLRVAEQMRPGSLDVYEYVARSGNTLSEGLESMVRLAPLLAEDLRLTLETDDDVARLVFGSVGRPYFEAVWDFALAACIRFGRELVRPPLRLLGVEFTRAAPLATDEYRRIFELLPRFGAQRNALHFERAFLDARLTPSDSSLRGVLERQASNMLASVPKSEVFVERVREVIAERLREGETGAREVARRLHVSTRTLQRRLSNSGTSHRALLDEVRHGLAVRYLDQGDLSLGHIADVLGFSDLSAFRKAFRRWEGRSPTARRTGDDAV